MSGGHHVALSGAIHVAQNNSRKGGIDVELKDPEVLSIRCKVAQNNSFRTASAYFWTRVIFPNSLQQQERVLLLPVNLLPTIFLSVHFPAHSVFSRLHP